MSYGSAREHELRYQLETTFGFVVDATWAAGVTFLAIDPKFREMTRLSIANENYRQRDLATRPMVRSLATGECSFGMYLHGRSTVVADDARATISSPEFPLARMLSNAWGGVRLGYRSLVASGTTAAPVVEAGDGAQFEAGDWVFAYDESVDATRGYFRKVLSISTDTFTMWPGHLLPTADANDVLGAVISIYPHAPRMKNQAHASHFTHSLWHQGELAEDVQQAEGVKLNLTGIDGLMSGEDGVVQFTGLSARVTKTGLTAATPADPLGDAPLATATGVDTIVSISAVGATLATVEAQAVSVSPGILSRPVDCVGGINGRSGYTLDWGTVDATSVEIAVDFDADWAIGWAAGTRYQVLIQVGTIAGEAYGIAMLNCELVEDPGGGDADGLVTSVLKFRALEPTNATAATGDALQKVRAKAEILLSCAR